MTRITLWSNYPDPNKMEEQKLKIRALSCSHKKANNHHEMLILNIYKGQKQNMIFFFDKENFLLMIKYYNITFQLLLHKLSRKQWLNSPCALALNDAKKTTFSHSTSTCTNRSLKILLFLSNYIDHWMVKEKITHSF